MQITINGTIHTLDDALKDTPLLWVLRDELGMTGTKFGCGISACGACTVHIDGKAIRACQVRVGEITGAVTTIENLDNTALQKAWIEQQVAQCGYCQSGQIMNAEALLAQIPHPTNVQIDEAMSGNLCRCGTYERIRAAIHQAAGQASLKAPSQKKEG